MIRNEFAKLRHLRIAPLVLALALAITGLSVASVLTSPDFADPATRSWDVLLAGLGLAVPTASPLLIAVLASRLVDVEHQSNGWLAAETSGVARGALCRAKAAALTLLVTAATVGSAVLLLLVGMALSVPGAPPIGRGVASVTAGLAVSLVVLALQVIIAARIDNQLIGLGLGVLGAMVAVFATGLPATLARLTPWGHYRFAVAADYQGGALVALAPDLPSIAVLGLLSGAAFWLYTRHLDRQEI